MKNNRVIFISLLVSAILLFAFVPSKISAVFMYSLILCAVISISAAFLSFLGVDIQNHLNTPIIVRGKKCEFEMTVKNKIPFTISYLNPVFTEQILQDDNSPKLIFASPITKNIKFKYKLTLKHCGNYEVGICELKVSDIFGLVTFKRSIPEQNYISVLPKIFELDGFPKDAYSDSLAPTPVRIKSQSVADIAGVRDYESRDSIKQIHWKLSVKQQKLLSKEFEEEKKHKLRLIVFFGTAETYSSEFDRIADCAVSTLNFLLKRGYEVELCCTNFNKTVLSESEIMEASRLISGSSVGFSEPSSIDESSDIGETANILISGLANSVSTEYLQKLASNGRLIFVSSLGEPTKDELKEFEKQRRLKIESYYTKVSNGRITFNR